MKKLTLLLLRSFGPFGAPHFISHFVLGDAVLVEIYWWFGRGKGLEWYIVVKLMVYVAITLVSLAFCHLLFSCHPSWPSKESGAFWINCMQSRQISLQRVMRPLMISAVLICLALSFFQLCTSCCQFEDECFCCMIIEPDRTFTSDQGRNFSIMALTGIPFGFQKR